MTITKLAVVVRMNVPKASIQKEFLGQLSEYLAKKYNTEEQKYSELAVEVPSHKIDFLTSKESVKTLHDIDQHVVLEVHGDVMMMRAGKTSPMLNMDIYHNSDMITQATKHADAGTIAKFVNEKVSIAVDRILVLFFDTRKCT